MRENTPQQDLDLDLTLSQPSSYMQRRLIFSKAFFRLPNMDHRRLVPCLPQVSHNEQGRRIRSQMVSTDYQNQVIEVFDFARLKRHYRAGLQQLRTLVDVLRVRLQEVDWQDKELVSTNLHTLKAAAKFKQIKLVDFGLAQWPSCESS